MLKIFITIPCACEIQFKWTCKHLRSLHLLLHWYFSILWAGCTCFCLVCPQGPQQFWRVQSPIRRWCNWQCDTLVFSNSANQPHNTLPSWLWYCKFWWEKGLTPGSDSFGVNRSFLTLWWKIICYYPVIEDGEDLAPSDINCSGYLVYRVN